MRKIKFSHEYLKLNDGCIAGSAVLVNVSLVQLEKLPKSFLVYDTAYTDYTGYSKGKKPTIRYFSLPPKGEYLLLLFQAGQSFLFTTLRSRYGKYGDKKKHYESLIGKEFEVVIG